MVSMTDLHLLEEIDFGQGPELWDADPDVCCAAYQLGACPHTEALSDEQEEADYQWWIDNLATPEEVARHIAFQAGLRQAEALREITDDFSSTEDEPF